MDNTKFYDDFDWNNAKLSQKLIEKIDQIILSIPNDVHSILDVGCGDGSISDKLSQRFSVIATDRSLNALKIVKTKKVQNSADAISLKTNSVDLVFSSETIEHLPDEIFYQSIEEFKRISKKYILLTFPNDENIEKLTTKCSECNFIFNRSYHLRSINSELIINLFPKYKIINQFEIGTNVRRYNKLLSKVKHKYSPSASWIPNYWSGGNEGYRSTVCPNCDHSFQIPYKFHPLATLCDLANIIISKKAPYQLCVLLEKI
jgi:ubiquinone/menaquinone biosynthesis C-methylase UbiE